MPQVVLPRRDFGGEFSIGALNDFPIIGNIGKPGKRLTKGSKWNLGVINHTIPLGLARMRSLRETERLPVASAHDEYPSAELRDSVLRCKEDPEARVVTCVPEA
ncbi:hypothetical protein STXM2123_5959 [Streptomyces sp. F-3]|nr:hypothetical protein STXM2123_5959 [Streptomyces sp. F-3]